MAGAPPRKRGDQASRLRADNEELRLRLAEAEQALDAIRAGQVDSLVVEGEDGPRIYSLQGADHGYRVLVEGMSEGAVTLAEDGTVLYCNSRFAGMIGAPLERLIGGAFQRLLPAASRELFEALVRQADGSAGRGELVLLSDSREPVPAYVSVSALHDQGGRRFCLVVTDLRAQKRSEALLASERLASSVIEQSAEAIVVCDRAGTVIRANAAAHRLCGTNPLLGALGEAFALELHDAQASGDRGIAPQRVAAAVLDGLVLRAAPATLLRRDGRQVQVLVSAAGLRGADGATIGCVLNLLEVTALSEAQGAVQASEERLRMALSAGAMAAWDWHVASGAVTWNEEHFRMLGYEPGSVTPSYEAWAARLHPEDRAGVEAKVRASLVQRGDYNSEFRVVEPNGTVRWAEARGRMEFDAAGTPVRQYGVMLDISERKRAEAALRQSEERFRMVIENSRDGINLMDLATGRYVIMSPAQVQMTGFTVEELSAVTAEQAYERVHPEDREVSVVQQREVAAGRDPGPAEYRWKVKSGEYRWFSDTRRLVRDSRGRPIAMVGTSRDITEQKRNEQALCRRELQLRVLIENVSSGVALIDASGQFVQINQKFLEMFGLPSESDVKNVNDTDWSAWEVTNANGQLLHVDEHPVRRAAMTREAVRSALVGVRCPSRKEQAWMLVSAAPLLAADGSVEHLICTYHDITDLKKAQDALREADQNKNRFLAILSHELRNPLAPIRTSLAILERAPGTEQAMRAESVIHRQVGHLAKLVDDLLDVTRVSSNKVQLKTARVALNQVVRRTVEDHRSLFEGAGIALRVSLASGPVMVRADEARVAQVLGNLLHNAAKFVPRGGATTVELSLDESLGQAVLRVADTGVGMAPEILARLFEPFVQADSTLDRSKGGLGLGLALVKGLVELHGGQVSASSSGPGCGAEFVVRLPLEAGLAESKTARPLAPTRGRRVLLIEDNVDAATSLRDVLELDDHVVEVAGSGPEGIEKARVFVPDVVLCDIGLPGMDGYAVARALRGEPALRRTLLVALSGYTMPEDLERAADAGFHRHIAKPPDLGRLTQVLGEQAP